MRSKSAPLAAAAIGVLAASLWAQQAVPPAAPQPATQPHPRDSQPYTNGALTGLNPNLPTLFIAGDSTAATGARTARDNNPIRGWAALLVDYFDTSKINLANYAIGGATLNSYLAPGRGGGPSSWDQLLAAVKPGDYVVIQFGQNSGPLAGAGEEVQERAGRGGGPPTVMHTHGWYVRKMINDVKAKKATPIPATLTIRDVWTDGKVERLKEIAPGKGGMSDWTRQVAAQEKVPLVDHSTIIADAYDKMGQTAADKLFQDHHLHTTTAGAILNCEAFIEGLKGLHLAPINDALNARGKALPTYDPAPAK